VDHDDSSSGGFGAVVALAGVGVFAGARARAARASAAAAAGPGGGDRRNAYLPAGFYAAGATAGKRNSSATLGAPSFVASHQNRDSGSSRGGFYNNGRGVSPPGSPMLAPGSRGGGSERGSTMLRVNDSQTSLNVAPTGRAPSAYLEDLFESHGQGRF